MPIPEDAIPLSPDGTPDRAQYTEGPGYYYELYMSWWPQYLKETAAQRREARAPTQAERDSSTYWSRRVHGQYGLIAKGSAAVPFAMDLLHSKNQDHREDGAAILGAIGNDEAVVDGLLAAAAAESDQQALDSLVLALGELKNRKAIRFLAGLVLDEESDGDTADLAAHSLGQIVRRRFDKHGNVIAAAREWLAAHPDTG